MSSKKRYILPLFIPFHGCRQRCIYCDQGAITGISSSDNIISSVQEQLNLWLSRRDQWDEAAFYGGTFASLNEAVRRRLYELVSPLPIRLSTCPDSISDAFLDELKLFNIKTVELGVQSLSDKVLRLNNRPYVAADVLTAFDRLAGTDAVIQMMVGMYGEGREEFLHTCDALGACKAGFARIYPTLVFDNTVLGSLYKDGQFVPLTGTESLMRSAWLYISLGSLDVNVIRTGLPYGDHSSLLAGYRHPAYGDIVRSIIYFAFGKVTGTFPRGEQYCGYKGIVGKRFTLPDAKWVATINDMAKVVKDHFTGGHWLDEVDITSFAGEIAER